MEPEPGANKYDHDPQAKLAYRFPRVAVAVFLVFLLGNFTELTLGILAKIFPPEPPSLVTVPAPPVLASKDQAIFRVAVDLYAVYFWVERGSGPAGGRSSAGAPFRNGFERALHTFHELERSLDKAELPDRKQFMPRLEAELKGHNTDAAQKLITQFRADLEDYLVEKAQLRRMPAGGPSKP